MNRLIDSTNKLLIYIPAYNCESRILSVIDEIPADIWPMADVLVVDNRSQDQTLSKIVEANQQKRWPKPIYIVQPNDNLGYSGSQKLAYRFFLDHPQFDAVMMLHGDGQYDPQLLPRFVAEMKSSDQVVYGYRSWIHHWKTDETPLLAYITIKSLSVLESLITGFWRREWHSGMVMYKRGFLERVNFDNITKTMHIDGHLLYAAGRLNVGLTALPIYKRYKAYEALGPTARVRYVFNVLKLMPRLRSIPVEKPAPILEGKVEEPEPLPMPGYETFPAVAVERVRTEAAQFREPTAEV